MLAYILKSIISRNKGRVCKTSKGSTLCLTHLGFHRILMIMVTTAIDTNKKNILSFRFNTFIRFKTKNHHNHSIKFVFIIFFVSNNLISPTLDLQINSRIHYCSLIHSNGKKSQKAVPKAINSKVF
jgi:hypothetical protein